MRQMWLVVGVVLLLGAVGSVEAQNTVQLDSFSTDKAPVYGQKFLITAHLSVNGEAVDGEALRAAGGLTWNPPTWLLTYLAPEEGDPEPAPNQQYATLNFVSVVANTLPLSITLPTSLDAVNTTRSSSLRIPPSDFALTYLSVAEPFLDVRYYSGSPFQVRFTVTANGARLKHGIPIVIIPGYIRTLQDCIDLNAVTGHADPDKHIEHWSGEHNASRNPNPLFRNPRHESFSTDADTVITITRAPSTLPAPNLYPHFKDYYARVILHFSDYRYFDKVDTDELALFIPDSQTDNTFTAEVDGSVLTYRITAPQTGEGPGSASLVGVTPDASAFTLPASFFRYEDYNSASVPFHYLLTEIAPEIVTGVSALTVDAGVTAIEAGAFAGAENLRRVKFLHREGLPEVPEDAFMAEDGAGAPKAVYTSYELLPALAEVAAFGTWVQEAAYAVVSEEGGPKAEVDLGYSSREVSIPWRLRDNFAGEYVSTEGHVTEVRAGEAFGETFGVGAGNPVTVTSPHALPPATYEASLTVADILPPVPLAIKVQALPPAAVTLSLRYDATLLPVTARIRASVLFDGAAPYAPEDITLAWHQDGAGKLRLEPEAGGWTVLVNSVDSGFGRMWCTLPEVWGGGKSPELAFYTPVSHLGKWPPTLVEGRIIVFEGQKQLPLSSRLRLREGETKYLYARVATNIPGEYNQHQTLLSLNLKWECISDLVTVAKTLDGTYAITPKPGSGGGGAGGKLVITVNADPTLPNLPAPVGLRSSGEEEAAVPVEAAEVSFIILKGAVVEEPAVEAEGEEETVVEAEVEGEPEGEGETEVVEEGEPEAVEPEEEATPEPEPEPVEEAPVVEAVSAPPVGTLEVVGGGEASYTVYTLSGRAVSAPLKAGLYIVKGEKGRVGKVVVR